MKKLKKITFMFVLLTSTLVSAQIKLSNNKIKVNTNIIKSGIQIKNLKNLSINELAAKKIPIISLAEKQGTGKPIKSWKITPNKPVNNQLSVSSFYGWLMADKWLIESSPFFDGPQISYWNPGWLNLRFNQSKNVEYRMKIKIQGSSHSGKSLYVSLGEMSGRYPINPDGLVHVVWSPTVSSNIISIGHLLPNNYEIRDYPRGLPRTSIEYVSIVRE